MLTMELIIIIIIVDSAADFLVWSTKSNIQYFNIVMCHEITYVMIWCYIKND